MVYDVGMMEIASMTELGPEREFRLATKDCIDDADQRIARLEKHVYLLKRACILFVVWGLYVFGLALCVMAH